MYSTFLPNYFSSPLITTIPNIKYAENGRQMSFAETEVQRLERLAIANASKSRSGSPTLSRFTVTGVTSPKMKLISEPYGDPIELMANRLAEELSISSDEFSSSDEELHVYYQTPKRVSSPSSRKLSFKPGHRRKRSSLSSIAEED